MWEAKLEFSWRDYIDVLPHGSTQKFSGYNFFILQFNDKSVDVMYIHTTTSWVIIDNQPIRHECSLVKKKEKSLHGILKPRVAVSKLPPLLG
jgi:hypothetical protein